jgi:hypothetical protein
MPFYKRLQDGKNIVVSVEFAVLGYVLDYVKTNRATNKDDYHFR